jgi:phthiodiolone/phenolphthiodiolone dimycocerosates ketoreductase
MTLPTLHSVELNRTALRGFEALGLHSAWLPDHLLGLFHTQLWREIEMSAAVADCDSWLDPFVLAGILSAETSLPLGTSVTDGTRRAGADLARAALTLNHAAQQGFILGIGAGEAESLLPFGYPFDKPVGTLERTLAQLRSILDNGRMPDGGLGRIGAPDQPAGRPPQVWLAAHGPRMLDLAGRFADGWIPCGLSVPTYDASYRHVCDRAAELGRPAPIASMFPLTVFGDSRDQVMDRFERQPMSRLVALFGPADMWRRHGLEHPAGSRCRGFPDVIPHALGLDELRDVAKRIPEGLLDEFLFIGNAQEVGRQLSAYGEVGLAHVVLADMTGLVQGLEDMPRVMGEVARLVAALESADS